MKAIRFMKPEIIEYSEVPMPALGDGEVLAEIAYASNSRNEDTVSVEICHPDEEGRFERASYDRAVELTAWLCREFSLDPEEDVIRHYDVTGKNCPRYYVEHPQDWEGFRKDVSAALEALLETVQDGA